MRTNLLSSALIAIAGFAAAPSFAGQYLGGEVGGFAPDPVVGGLVSREQVQTEAERSVQRGDMIGGLVLQQRASVTSGSALSRDAVRAEAAYAVRHGLIRSGEV